MIWLLPPSETVRLNAWLLSGTSSQNLHIQKSDSAELQRLLTRTQTAAGGGGRGQRHALLSGARGMHHPMGGGAESCSADPQQVKGLGWGWGWGQGLVGVEDRDAIWPSRAPSTKPIQRRGRGLWNTLTETTPTPPETHTPAGWRPGPLRRDGHTRQHGVRQRRTEGTRSARETAPT